MSEKDLYLGMGLRSPGGPCVCVSVVLACSYRVNINILVGGEGGGQGACI